MADRPETFDALFQFLAGAQAMDLLRAARRLRAADAVLRLDYSDAAAVAEYAEALQLLFFILRIFDDTGDLYEKEPFNA